MLKKEGMALIGNITVNRLQITQWLVLKTGLFWFVACGSKHFRGDRSGLVRQAGRQVQSCSADIDQTRTRERFPQALA